MWFLVVFIVALLLVAAMAPKPNIENARAAKLGDFQFPRSKHGDPVPMVWGTVRQKSPIIAWFGDYKPVPITQKVKKGLFSSRHVIVGYKNYMGIDCVISLGPNVKVKKIWADTHVIWKGEIDNGDIFIDMPNLFGGDREGGGLRGTITFYNGDFNPEQDAYLVQKIGPNVPAYNGFARAVFKGFYIGTSTTPKAFSFEISRLTNGLSAEHSIMPNNLDVNPMEIAYDLVTNGHGALGNLPEVLDLDSFKQCAKTLFNENLGMSLIVQAPVQSKDILEEVMRIADGVMYKDPATSKIVSKLIRQDYKVDELITLDESSISSLKNFQKTTWENTFNQCRVTFKDRNNNYDDSVAITQDFANINFQNRVKSTEINVPGCAVAYTASVLASRQLSMLNVPLYKCDITVNRKAFKLRPGSVFILNWKPFNISRMVMRVTKIDFGDLTSNSIKISCVQDRFSSALVTFAPPEQSEWQSTDTQPRDIKTKHVFTPPAFLAFANSGEKPSIFDNAGRLYSVAFAPSSMSLSYDAIVSDSNSFNNYILALDNASYNGGGTLVNAYSASEGGIDRFDASGKLIVNNIPQYAIDKLHNYSSLEQARDGSAMLLIGNELFVYVGFVDNGNGQVTFPNVHRGVLDTLPANHNAGARVWFINSADGLLSELIPINKTGYIKLLDQTPTGQLNNIEATTSNAVINNRASLPLPVQYPTINGNRQPKSISVNGTINVSWKNRSRSDSHLRVYSDNINMREDDTQTIVQWSMPGNNGREVTKENSFDIDTKGQKGMLTVNLTSQIISNGKTSSFTETMRVNIT